MEWNGGILKQGSWVVPKGAKDQYWSMKVLALMSDPKRQAANAEVLGYSGMHLESNQYVAEKIRPLLPLFPDNLKKQIWLDQEWWTKNGAEMGERWNKWMLSRHDWLRRRDQARPDGLLRKDLARAMNDEAARRAAAQSRPP